MAKLWFHYFMYDFACVAYCLSDDEKLIYFSAQAQAQSPRKLLSLLFVPFFRLFCIIPTSDKKYINNFNLMIPCKIAAYSTWRTIAIRIELNVNRRHDGTFMKMTLNLLLSVLPFFRPKKNENVKHIFWFMENV